MLRASYSFSRVRAQAEVTKLSAASGVVFASVKGGYATQAVKLQANFADIKSL